MKSEVKRGRTFPPGWKTHLITKHVESDGTGDTEECTASQYWRRRVRKPGNTTVGGTSPGTQCSRCDTQRNVSGIHADRNVETLEHDSVSTTNPQKLVAKVVIESTRVTGVDQLEEPDENNVLRNRRLTENDDTDKHERLG